MADRPIVLEVAPLGAPPWVTADPFLFCVHHDDAYPAGNEAMGPAASLNGRDLGQDFGRKDGWSMYHGEVVPGFPQHPHRGFETVTVVERGFVDHADSMGATARYGAGDVQWLTAGRGIVHAEMFPLRRRDAENPLELFQIWLNLPRKNKLAEPHFSMFWADAIPTVERTDEAGRVARVRVIAGAFGEVRPPAPPPASWAAEPEHDVTIWTLRLEPGARLDLPPGREGSRRVLYFFAGDRVTVSDARRSDDGGRTIARGHVAALAEDAPARLVAGDAPASLLVLGGRPIGEPVAAHGPFVMNTRAEIQQAFVDYQRTRFGGWPWPEDGPVHAREEGRFARHADGRVERAE